MTTQSQQLNRPMLLPSRLLAAVLCVLTAGGADAATNIWDGGDGTSPSWSTTNNWDAAGAPAGASNTVVIIDGNYNVGASSARLQQDIDNPLTLSQFRSRSPTGGGDPIGHTFTGGDPLKFVVDGATRPLIYGQRKGNTDISNDIVIDGASTTLDVRSKTWSVLLNGQISGAGALYFNAGAGGGGLDLGSANSYSGGTTYHNDSTAGESWNYFRIKASGALGSGDLSIRGGNRLPYDSSTNDRPGGTCFYGQNRVHGNNISLLADASVSVGDPAGAAPTADRVDLTGNIELDQYTLYLRGRGTGTVSGNIASSGGTGSRGLTKLGKPGSWTLSGSNTYAGATAVAEGTLLVTGIHIGGGDYTVSSNATLGGNGTIDLGALNGSVTLEAGGNLSPGTNTGDTGAFTFSLGAGMLDVSAIAGTGGLRFDLDTIANSDKVVVGSTLDVGTLDFADFSFTALGGFGPGTYTLFDAGSITGSVGTANGIIDGRAALLMLNSNNVELLMGGPHSIHVWQNSGANWGAATNWGGDVPDSGGNGGELALLPSAASVVNPTLGDDFTIGDLEILNDQTEYSIVNSGAGARTLTIEPGADNPGEGICLSGGNTSIGTAAGGNTGIRIAPKGAQTWDITGTLTLYGNGNVGGNVNDNSGEITKTGPGTILLDNGGQYGGGLKRLVVEQGTITATAWSKSQINIFASTGDALTMYGNTELSDFRLAIPEYADQSIRFNGSGSGGARIATAGCTLGGPANGASTKTFNIDDGDDALDMEITATFTEWAGAGKQTTIGIRKTGPGTLAIDGGSHDGTTTVEQGTLLLNGSHTVDDSRGTWGGTPTGSYTVSSNATLGGRGTIDLSGLNGSVTIQAGGNLSPGDTSDPTGTFTLTLGTGSLDVSAISGTGGLAFDLGPVADSDKVVVGSALNVGTLNFDDFTFTPRSGFGPGTYTLFNATTVAGLIGTENAGTINDYEATLVLNDDNKSVELVVAGVQDGTVFVVR